MGVLLMLFLIVLTVFVGIYSHRLGRLWFLHVLLCFIFSPIIIGIYLLVVGPTKDKIRQKIEQEELARMAVRGRQLGPQQSSAIIPIDNP